MSWNAVRISNGLDFRLIELNIEKMEEEIENLNSTVEEHDGIIGKGCHIFGHQSARKTVQFRFRPSTTISINDKRGHQLKLQSCFVIWLKL